MARLRRPQQGQASRTRAGDSPLAERARPGRSAVLGLVAAAHGIDRSDEAAHRELEDGLHFAVRTDGPRRPVVDYHTAQTPKGRRGWTFATRREELESDALNTVLSVREWRTDAFFTVVLWPRAGGTVDPDVIAECLCRPGFALYVGRKSAPPGLPLNPTVVEAATFMRALDARRPNEVEQSVLHHTHIDGVAHGAIACDHDAPGVPTEGRVERRRDAIASRVRWQFAERLERIASPENGEA